MTRVNARKDYLIMGATSIETVVVKAKRLRSKTMIALIFVHLSFGHWHKSDSIDNYIISSLCLVSSIMKTFFTSSQDRLRSESLINPFGISILKIQRPDAIGNDVVFSLRGKKMLKNMGLQK